MPLLGLASHGAFRGLLHAAEHVYTPLLHRVSGELVRRAAHPYREEEEECQRAMRREELEKLRRFEAEQVGVSPTSMCCMMSTCMAACGAAYAIKLCGHVW